MNALETIKDLLKQSMKTKDTFKTGILRLIIGEVDRKQVTRTLASVGEVKKEQPSKTDEEVYSVIRKIIEGNNERIAQLNNVTPAGQDPPAFQIDFDVQPLIETANAENVFLQSLLPKTISQQEIEAFILNQEGTLFEQIQSAKNDGQAMGLAMKEIKKASLSVLSADVKAVVKKIMETK